MNGQPPAGPAECSVKQPHLKFFQKGVRVDRGEPLVDCKNDDGVALILGIQNRKTGGMQSALCFLQCAVDRETEKEYFVPTGAAASVENLIAIGPFDAASRDGISFTDAVQLHERFQIRRERKLLPVAFDLVQIVAQFRVAVCGLQDGCQFCRCRWIHLRYPRTCL